MEQGGLMRKQGKKWFDLTTSFDLHDGSEGVCRLVQTYTPIEAARKYLTTITDVHILNLCSQSRHVAHHNKHTRSMER